ncbi:SHOCT domain-containing protein [Marinagarivorans cellulosilyticus]|uniref:SHOCT domain-containing protein n=1 Tax=Marinagarivorans cellulosilyticus TaxID=2721545 RepID=A0AAN2BJ81_9GAMM|nr:SHOCT domain-containing protein [Marinagarivorans cellulosilyticus]BCD96646.1 hypothetical protein MARGE09_P0846 [Marinagarivorans cellulosilyticus]
MQNLTPVGQQTVNDLSCRYNLSYDAVMHMLIAVNNGAGSMAQFNCPELGGGGQWMAGGMTMVGDMFNHGLKNTVNNLCAELANALANNTIFAPNPTTGSQNWWPNGLGQPSSSGGQNNSRYALFPNRLAVEVNGAVTVYDTLDHNIGGVSQQQGSNDSLMFNSQYGNISVSNLPVVSGGGTTSNQNFVQPAVNNAAPVNNPQPQPSQFEQSPSFEPAPSIQPSQSATGDVFQLIEKLANLRDIGAVTEEEYQNKKNDLLSRI